MSEGHTPWEDKMKQPDPDMVGYTTICVNTQEWIEGPRMNHENVRVTTCIANGVLGAEGFARMRLVEEFGKESLKVWRVIAIIKGEQAVYDRNGNVLNRYE